MVPEITRQAALEQAQADFESKDLLLSHIPEVDPWTGSPKRAIMEQMMNNALAMLKNPAIDPSGMGVQGAMEATATQSTNVPSTTGQIMPVLTRFFPDEIAFDLVTTQPMNMPTGLIIYINEKYGDANASAVPSAVTAGDRLDAKPNTRNYADQATEGADAKTLYMDTNQITIDTKTKVLKNIAIPQGIQDWQATLGQNLESAMNEMTARALRREVGSEIIYQIVSGALAGNVNWNATAPSGSTVLNTTAHKKTIWESVIDAQNLVYAKIYKMPNFMLTSPTTWARFRKTHENFEVNPLLSSQPELLQGRYLAGTTDSGMRCYVDPWFPVANKAVVGYRGNTFNDAGAFYAPYVPIWWTPGFYDPDAGGKWKRMALTRYGKAASGSHSGTMLIDGNYYATITITTS